MKDLEIVKEVGGFMVEVGVGTILGCIVGNNVPLSNMNVIKKACTIAGSVTINNYVGEKVRAHYNKKFDEVTNIVKNLVEEKE